MFARIIAAAILVIAGALFVLWPSSPLNMPSTYRDSGVFLYAGSHLLEGEIPYRDVWDHKPPIVFFIDAAGLALADGSRWGVWALEVLSLALAASIAFRLMRDAFGLTPAIASTLVWLLSLVFVIEGGNLTEEYALPLQFGCFWLARQADDTRRSYLIGLLCGLAFFTKQTTVGIGIAFVLYVALKRLFFHRGPRLRATLTFLSLGGLTAAIPVVAFFVANNAALDFWNAAFVYNFFYSSRTELLRSTLGAVLAGLEALSHTSLTTFAFFGWGAGLCYVILNRRTLDQGMAILVALALIDLPIELLMVGISGNQFGHYYMTLLPVFAILTGWFAYILITGLAHITPLTRAAGPAIALFVLVSFVSIQAQPLREYKAIALAESQVQVDNAVNYIDTHTNDQDYVLMWGAETRVNFFAHRSSPTQYVYQLPLYREGYTSKAMIEDFLGDIVENKPSLIIDTVGKGIVTNNFGVASPQITESLQVIQSEYRQVAQIGSWTVYRYMPN